MIDAGAPSTWELLACVTKRCARPTGGAHGLTTRGPAQCGEGAGEGRASKRGISEKRGQGHYKGRAKEGYPKKRGQGQYEGRSPLGPRPKALLTSRLRARKARRRGTPQDEHRVRAR
jgi:hypothetical protein